MDLLATMYATVVRTVMVSGDMTEDFAVEPGVPQGAVLCVLY